MFGSDGSWATKGIVNLSIWALRTKPGSVTRETEMELIKQYQLQGSQRCELIRTKTEDLQKNKS